MAISALAQAEYDLDAAIKNATKCLETVEVEKNRKFQSTQRKYAMLQEKVDDLRADAFHANTIKLVDDEVSGYATVLRVLPDALMDCGITEKQQAETFLRLIRKMFGEPGR